VHTVKFGLHTFGLNPRYLPEVAELAECNHFESVWVPEHLVLAADWGTDFPYTKDGDAPIRPKTPLYDPWAVLGFAALSTTTIRLATGVYVLPLRHPLAVARSAVTLDMLSRGRLTLGIGVGWHQPEFEAVGVPFSERGRRTDEIIPLLRRLWSEEVISSTEGHYQFPPIQFEPKPRQPRGIPIEVGGTSRAALRRAGQLGDGWIQTGSADVEGLADLVAQVHEHRRRASRDQQPFEVSFWFPIGQDLPSVRAAAAAGATRVITRPDVTSHAKAADYRDFVLRYAEEVIRPYLAETGEPGPADAPGADSAPA
jgi:probable F420-dependent oxidoreductase